MGGLLSTGAVAKGFVLAGKATITLVSQKTGTRFTYKVTASEDGKVFFVKVLTGSDNESSYTFAGTIFAQERVQIGGGSFGPMYGMVSITAPRFVVSKKSKLGSGTPSVRAFMWAWSYITRGELPPECEIWHEGKCGCCGRKLTTPESISIGLGPVCAEKAAA